MELCLVYTGINNSYVGVCIGDDTFVYFSKFKGDTLGERIKNAVKDILSQEEILILLTETDIIEKLLKYKHKLGVENKYEGLRL
jgi:hypothetical protein